jgi:putative ABC transport system ATP-binding protein
LIEVRSLTKSIDTGTHRVEILRGIDLEIPKGQFAAIMGPSGSGKSTLLGLLAGLDFPTTGQVLLDGEDITRLGEDQMAAVRGRKIGFVFQSYQLISTLTAEENVLLPMELAGAERGGRARARELLERVGLKGRFDHYPVQLSGGEQQRVALARAFALRPPILLADEPTGNLDTATGKVVLDLLLALNREEGATLVMVTHEQSLAECADRRIHLRDGLVVSE